jgi:hypothetical protein
MSELEFETAAATLNMLVARRRRRRNAEAVVTLPDGIDEFLKGKPRQAVRTNVTRARANGVTRRKLGSVEEQRQRVGEVLERRGSDVPRVAEVARSRLRHCGRYHDSTRVAPGLRQSAGG